MSRNPKSLFLVLTQLATLAFILLSGPLVARNLFLLILENVGIVLILWAVYVMRISKLRVTPEPAEGSVLVTMGPYRYIRHSMYAGILLLAFSLILEYALPERIVAGFILLAVLLVKIKYEESLLAAHFTDYASYKTTTSRLIPFVY